jgi:hypothetical protein
LFVTVIRGIVFRELDAGVEASGPHDFSVRLLRHSSRAHPRPPHPVPTSVTIAKRPSVARDGRPNASDLPDVLSEIFLRAYLDRANQLDPSQEFSLLAQREADPEPAGLIGVLLRAALLPEPEFQE